MIVLGRLGSLHKLDQEVEERGPADDEREQCLKIAVRMLAFGLGRKMLSTGAILNSTSCRSFDMVAGTMLPQLVVRCPLSHL